MAKTPFASCWNASLDDLHNCWQKKMALVNLLCDTDNFSTMRPSAERLRESEIDNDDLLYSAVAETNKINLSGCIYNIMSFLKVANSLVWTQTSRNFFYLSFTRRCTTFHSFAHLYLMLYTQTGCSNAGAALSITLNLHIMREELHFSHIIKPPDYRTDFNIHLARNLLRNRKSVCKCNCTIEQYLWAENFSWRHCALVEHPINLSLGVKWSVRLVIILLCFYSEVGGPWKYAELPTPACDRRA